MAQNTWISAELSNRRHGPRRRARAILGAALAAYTGCTGYEEADTDGTDTEGEEQPEWRAYSPPKYPDALLPDNGVAASAGPTTSFTGLAAASESLAAIEGRRVLANGGDAIDAAVVVASMLNVVEPQSSGIGGGAIWLIYRADLAKTIIIDCREWAPKAATDRMFATQSSIDLKSTSGISVGIPGSLHCMNEAINLKPGQGLTLAQALAPAIATAKNGFNISSRLADATTSDRLRNESGNAFYDEARKVFRPNGSALATNAKLTQTNLGNTLQAVASGGLAAFYNCGDKSGIASAIVATQAARRSSYSDGAGRMTCDDLLAFKPDTTSVPLELDYHGYKIVTTPAPTSGVHLLEMLGMLDRFNIGGSNFGFGQVNTMNVMLESMRLAFADRALWLGDPKFVSVPQSGMLNSKYLSSRSALITVGKRRSTITAGDPRSFEPQAQKQPADLAKMADNPAHDSTETTHFVTSDAAGNIVSVTTTVSDLWGTGLMTQGRGFMLNDQLLNFNDTPTAKSSPFNPGANDVAPFKRPRTTIAPTLVFLGGKPVATMGSPGGTTIINSVLGFLLDLIDHRLSLQVSVAKPRFSLDSPGSTSIEIESGFSSSVRSSLGKLGYKFTSESAIGAVQAAIVYPFGAVPDRKYGTADPRRIGAVEGISDPPAKP